MYSSIRARAGLVALTFVLIISLVSAVPIPTRTPHSVHCPSTPSWDLIQRDTGVLARFPLKSPISTLPATTGVLTGDNTFVDADNQLVRRNARLNRKIREAFHNAGHAIKHAFQKAGHAIKHAFQKAGHAIKHAFQKVGQAIKHVAQKIGNGIKTAAKKVWHFIKHTGAVIAKVGLKIVSGIQQAGSKIVGWIPGIGKPLGKALGLASKATSALSDRIHVHLSKKMEKTVSGVDKANKVMEYIPRDLSEEEGEDFWY